ncbi:MAG: hypothetical protein ACK53L_23135, partial [Pirellulaceae bacterium]
HNLRVYGRRLHQPGLSFSPYHPFRIATMASVSIPDQNRTLERVDEIRDFLAPFGIWYERWEVAGRLPENPSNETILET